VSLLPDNAVERYLLGFAVVVALVEWALGVFWLKRSIKSSDEGGSSNGPNWNFWKGVAAVYLGSIAVGVLLAGLQDPFLPEVRLESSKEQRKSGWLLSNSNNYWYVINCANELRAIPNKAAPDDAATPSGDTTTPESEADWEGHVVADSQEELDCSVAAPSTPDLDASTDSGNNTDNITNYKKPTFNGTAEAGSTVTLYDGQASLGSTTADVGSTDDNGNKGWIFTVPNAKALSDADHSITAQATDEAGNKATSNVLSVTIDTQTQVSTPDLDASTDSGNNTDNITNYKKLTFNGTAEACSTVTLYDRQASLDTKPADDGNWTILSGELGEGSHWITAQARDEQENEATSSPLSVTIDAQVQVCSLPPPKPPSVATPNPHKQPPGFCPHKDSFGPHSLHG
jgi:hypothetical protein